MRRVPGECGERKGFLSITVRRRRCPGPSCAHTPYLQQHRSGDGECEGRRMVRRELPTLSLQTQTISVQNIPQLPGHTGMSVLGSGTAGINVTFRHHSSLLFHPGIPLTAGGYTHSSSQQIFRLLLQRENTTPPAQKPAGSCRQGLTKCRMAATIL